MWSFASNAIATSFGLRKVRRDVPSQANVECSDNDDDGDGGETRSNAGRDEGLECPICWESFNIVENVPHVLLCGHSLCENCVLGLQCAIFELSPQQRIRIPFLIPCPWCQLLSPRLVYGGTLKFPRKNFFLLWMVERLNGRDMMRSGSFLCRDHQVQHTGSSHLPSRLGFNGGGMAERPPLHFSLHKSLDFFMHFAFKFPLVIVFLLVVFFVIPVSAVVLLLYFLVTALFAIPCILVLYFAYPTLAWLLQQINS